MILNLKYFLGYLNKLWLNFRLQTKLILNSKIKEFAAKLKILYDTKFKIFFGIFK